MAGGRVVPLAVGVITIGTVVAVTRPAGSRAEVAVAAPPVAGVAVAAAVAAADTGRLARGGPAERPVVDGAYATR